tara:strand:+ start:302 stop:472 length:171 start_codon:yes stop_codon:yes gene_type:complete
MTLDVSAYTFVARRLSLAAHTAPSISQLPICSENAQRLKDNKIFFGSAVTITAVFI